MATDPRAPRLAAATTLVAASLLLATGGNLYFERFGQPGVTAEELVAIVSALLLLVVARFANVERDIPELGRSTDYRGPEDLDQLTTVATTSRQYEEVNPTTANILSSILGQNDQAGTTDVSSAMSTLSSGAFGEAVNQTMKESWEQSESTMNKRQAVQADEITGQTLQRVHVEPVPLPGQEDNEPIDPRTIPGLEPDRVFLTEGVDSVPLPDLPSTHPVSEPASLPSPTVPDFDLPDIPSNPPPVSEPASLPSPTVPDFDLPDLPEDSQEAPEPEGAPQQHSPVVPKLELPDLDDLFFEEVKPTQAPTTVTPDLPNLDDLF